jgi:hypothetical protein
VDGFWLWRADRRERQWQRELDEMMEREELLRKANQRMIDEAYRHSVPPDPEAIIRAERMTKAGALDQQGNVLYGWTVVRPETLNEVGTITNEAWAGASVASRRARVERQEARRQLDTVEMNRNRPGYQQDLFDAHQLSKPARHADNVGRGPDSFVASFSPASEPAVRDVPFVSTGGGSFDGGGSSGSYGGSCSSSSSGGSSSYSSGDSGSSSGGSSGGSD